MSHEMKLQTKLWLNIGIALRTDTSVNGKFNIYTNPESKQWPKSYRQRESRPIERRGHTYDTEP